MAKYKNPWKDCFEECFPDGLPPAPSVPGTLIRGTCYFVDRVAVAKYYRPIYRDLTTFELATLIAEKERAGEIKLGWPPGCDASNTILLDGGTRYGIIER